MSALSFPAMDFLRLANNISGRYRSQSDFLKEAAKLVRQAKGHNSKPLVRLFSQMHYSAVQASAFAENGACLIYCGAKTDGHREQDTSRRHTRLLKSLVDDAASHLTETALANPETLAKALLHHVKKTRPIRYKQH